MRTEKQFARGSVACKIRRTTIVGSEKMVVKVLQAAQESLNEGGTPVRLEDVS